MTNKQRYTAQQMQVRLELIQVLMRQGFDPINNPGPFFEKLNILYAIAAGEYEGQKENE